ncbi:MAG: T9SS type A sorting domain-containing protein [Saprospiraceae bacterium]|nr:T9SS type A sorting domain-containing protein [Saprospiraceae bacterium]
MKNFILLMLAFVGFANLQAQSIFTNPITGTNPNNDNPYTFGQTVNANITASGIGRGSGITSANANNRYNASGWNSVALDVNDYFTFTLTPNATYNIDFVSFTYVGQASASGPVNFALRSSLDGFSTDIATPPAGGATISLAAGTFQNALNAVEFRLYAWGASAGTGTYSVNSFTFNGTVSVCAPSVAPSGFSTSNITTSSIELAWTGNGNGDNVIVFAKIGAPVDLVPVSGTNYSLGQIISGNTVMYKGNANGVQLSGLFSGTEYHFAVFSYNSGGPCYNTSAISGSATTECNAANVIGLSGNCGNAIAAPAWSHSSCYDEYLVVAKEGSSVTGTPAGDGSAYTANLVYGTGDAFGGGFIVYKGTGNNTGGDITSLNVGVNYYFKVFTRRGTAWSSGVETTCSPAIPTVNTDFFRSNVATGNWTNPSSWQSSSDGIVWSNASAAPTEMASGVSIRNGHNITSSVSRTILKTTVETGGTLTISGGILTLEDDGTAAHDLIIFGTVIHQSSAWVIDVDATWIIQNGGTYVHNTFSAISASLDKATISPGSNFIYRNTNIISLPGRTYGNLTFENAGPTPLSGTAGGGDPITILGNLRIGTLYTINNGLSNIWDIDGDFRIDGAFNISSNDGAKVIHLGGDLIVSAGADLFENTTGSGTIIFDGIEEQWLNASGDILNEVHFTIANPAGVGLLSHLSLPANLNLTAGHLSLYNFNFEIAGTISGISSSRYIRTNGTGEYRTLISDTPVLFPIGNSSYNPLLLSISAGSSLLGARVLDQVLLYGLTGTPFTDRVVNRLWDVNGDLAGAELTITVQWNEDEELTLFDRANSYISNWFNGIWDPGTPGPASGTDPYTKTRSGILDLGVFGVGSAGALPVTLLTLNTIREKNNQLIYWTFEAAERFDYFEVEHSKDAINFNALGRVTKADLSTKSGEAKYLHLNPGTGIHYYRLKMVDLDGSYKHSHVVQGRIDGKGSVRPLSTFISAEGLNVNVETSVNSLELRLFDQLGRSIYHSTQAAEAGVINIPVSNLSSGLYYLQVNADGVKETHKLVR